MKTVEKLHNYLLRMGVSKARFALELGVTREAVRAWCAGEKFPTLLHVAEIERMTNGVVTAKSFYNTEMLEKLDRQGVVSG